jgi:hypothetical protein
MPVTEGTPKTLGEQGVEAHATIEWLLVRK